MARHIGARRRRLLSRVNIPLPEVLQAAVQLHQAGRLQEAENLYRQILQVAPRNGDALHMLGVLSFQQGRNAVALDLVGRAAAIQPSSAVLLNLGKVQEVSGMPDAAIASYRQALVLQPGSMKILLQLGMCLKEQGCLDEAAACLREAWAQAPGDARISGALGHVLQKQGRLDAAIVTYRLALELQPDAMDVRNNLAIALQQRGRVREAAVEFRELLARNPDSDLYHDDLLLALCVGAARSPAEYLEEARHYGARVRARARPYTSWRTGPAGGEVACLNVGLVSGDLRVHPVGYFLESVVAHLDPERVRLTAYSTRDREDALTERLRPHFGTWHVIASMDDETAARRIHDDGIHVLMDLAGHTLWNRLPLFAWKPAPVQASWLGYFASTGVAEVDYLLTDPLSVPPAESGLYSETLCYLPQTRLCFSPPEERVEVAPLPAMRRDCITFGTFQRMKKLNPAVIALWARVLAAIPGSCLRIQNKESGVAEVRDEILAQIARAGVSADRVVFMPPTLRVDYLAAHAEVDVLLDTFPFPGGTTTCEALWMGVPTLTLAGDSLLSRQGAALMHAAGLDEWIARDAEDFVLRAVDLTADRERLATLRVGLRARVSASPLMDATRFAADITNALFRMWRGES